MSENEGRHVATIKFGPGYDAPWLVVRADSQEALIGELAEAFAIEPAEDATLGQVIVTASAAARGLHGAVATLGGKIESAPVKPAARGRAKSAASKPANDTPAPTATPATATPDVEPAASEADPVIAALDAVTSMDGFRKVWAANQEAFKRPEVAEHAKLTRARLDSSS